MKTLTQIQKAIQVPKEHYNKFGGYHYRNCEDILEALKPMFDEDDKFTLTDELILVGDRFYIKATATFNGHSTCGYAREALTKKGMDESQITGTASSYARKYALNGLFCIDDAKDMDKQNKSKPEDEERINGNDGKKPAGYTSAEIKKIWSQIKEDIEGSISVSELGALWKESNNKLKVIKQFDEQSYIVLEDAKDTMKALLNNAEVQNGAAA